MKTWYAVMMNRADNDWGYGSYDLEEAKMMLKEQEEPDGYIAVIEMGNDPICVEELTLDDILAEEQYYGKN